MTNLSETCFIIMLEYKP